MNKILIELIQVLQEQLSFNHRYTNCGADFGIEECNPCSDYYKCKNSLELSEKLECLIEKVERLHKDA